MRLRSPSPAFVVAVAALVVSLGGTSYAVSQIGSADIANNSIRSVDIQDGTIGTTDIKDGAITVADIRESARAALAGAKGEKGDTGPAGAGRWALVDANGAIIAQSGGFTVAAAYPELANTAPDGSPSNALRANGNVYINANEDLSNNGVYASIALQNQVDQNADGILSGRSTLPDANPEFSGEITATMCGITGVVGCAPTGTNNNNHFVVSPRNSDGTVTTSTTHKRFYIIITGDSTDYVAPPAS